MKSDRELLEAAAKAAGMDVHCVGNGEPNGPVSFYAGPEGLWWNPLTDDGDALRLAVKLRISVRLYQDEAGAGSEHEPYGSDPYAATRRAIVRAAAEMGK